MSREIQCWIEMQSEPQKIVLHMSVSQFQKILGGLIILIKFESEWAASRHKIETDLKEIVVMEFTEAPNAPKQPAHGVGDRSQYYDKWDKYVKEETKNIEEAEIEETKKANEAIGKRDDVPLSEDDAKDRKKREALKEAKKVWDGVKSDREAKRIVLSKQTDLAKHIIDFERDLDSKPIVLLKECSNCNYVFPSNLHLIKLFIENCKNCVFTVECNLLTSNMEVAHCDNVTVVLKHLVHTVQVDLSERVNILFTPGMLTSQCKIYHSAVKQIRIQYDWKGNDSGIVTEDDLNATNDQPCYQLLDDFALTPQDGKPIKEHQFVTTFDKELITDLVLRDASEHPTTQREIDEHKRKAEQHIKALGLSMDSPEAREILHILDPVTPFQQGNKYKTEGNKAFKERDYGQAQVHYTQGIEAIVSCVDTTTGNEKIEHDNLLAAMYSNRAACCLKLGEHDAALKDAESCLEIDKTNVKAMFRKGLSLHALARYREACPVLVHALSLKPGDKEIKDALMFAERRAQMQMR